MKTPSTRLFAGTELAARIERAEKRLVADGAHTAQRRDPDAGVLVLPVAGGVAVFAGKGSPLNKVAGLGFGGLIQEAEFDALERAFDERGVPVQVEFSTLGEPGVAAQLTRRGYVLTGFENVLGLDISSPDAVAQAAKEVEITPGSDAELALWLDVVVGGFAHPDTQGVAGHEEFPREAIERAIGDLASSDGFLRYLARIGGEPAGGASLRLFEGVAQLAGAATLPAYRRRGVQSSLLAARLAVATSRGCDVAVVTTQPGSKSQENVQRQGFELLYTRAILVREG